MLLAMAGRDDSRMWYPPPMMTSGSSRLLFLPGFLQRAIVELWTSCVMRGKQPCRDEHHMQPLIRFQHLSKTYSRGQKLAHAIVALDLEIAPGLVYGSLVRNSAGKTTAFRLLLGLIHATRGSAMLYGQDVSAIQQL